MSLDPQKLIRLTRELGFESVAWEARASQCVSQIYANAYQADVIADTIAIALKINNSDVVSTVKSRSRPGVRVIITDIPRFTAALAECEKVRNHAFEQMKASVKTHQIPKIAQGEIALAKCLLNRLCTNDWRGLELQLGMILSAKFPIIRPCSEYDVEPHEQDQGCWIKSRSQYILWDQNAAKRLSPDYWEEKAFIDADDINFILKTLKQVK
jgi:hypothetical protein